MSVVPGDAASLSACARTAVEVAHRLAPESASLGREVDDLGEGWTGRASVATRRSGDGLVAATAVVATQLERVALVLQDQSTDLADLVARERGVREHAAAAGLDVRDGRVVLAWGVSGTADAGAQHEREAVRDALQGDLDLVAAQHARRRDFVLGVLRDSTAALADVSHGLRRG
ncbi:hypothetical protein ACK8HX_14480 [Oryzobacter sp. R7]|uniref:hypothetical protein n=1 Tax=Oryzobacter faecalis TaxID=3388656 RepID=UPI00398D2D19